MIIVSTGGLVTSTGVLVTSTGVLVTSTGILVVMELNNGPSTVLRADGASELLSIGLSMLVAME